MYIDQFCFSPFEIKKNVVHVWQGQGSFVVKDGKIYCEKKEITPDQFYDEFLEIAEYTWFVKDFIRFYKNRERAIPSSIAEFAVYCMCKFNFLTEDIWKKNR